MDVICNRILKIELSKMKIEVRVFLSFTSLMQSESYDWPYVKHKTKYFIHQAYRVYFEGI